MKLSELAIIIRGYSPKPTERKKNGKYLIIGGRNIRDGKLIQTDSDSYINELTVESSRRALVRKGDIVISTLFDKRKLYIFKSSDPVAIVNDSCAIVRNPENNDYIVSYLKTSKGQEAFLENASRATVGATIPRLSIKNLGEIEIPILPVEEIRRLGDAHLKEFANEELEKLKNELLSKNQEIEALRTQRTEMEFIYQNRIKAIESQIDTNDLKNKIKHGETSTLEFKSTLRWNIKKNNIDKDIENAVLKTIVAFCNTNGGELLIGVADNKDILGLHYDKFDNTDKFLLHLRNLLSGRIKPNILQFVSYETLQLDDESVCSVKCVKSNEAVWLKTDIEHFYVRSGPSSTELVPSEAVNYIFNHFKK